MRSLAIFTFIAGVSAVSAQQTTADGPVRAKRLPPEKVKSRQSLVDRYDFNAQVEVLQDDSRLQPPAAPVKPIPADKAVSEGVRSVPLDFLPKTDVHLNPTARQAVEMSEKWIAEDNPPAPGRDGRVLYAYGAGLPSVVCAPLRICMVELQSGEKLVGEPQIGDSVRWHLSPALFGTGDSATPVIVLKPLSPGLDTNLLITTDRRAYYLRLLSKPDDYVARVAFAYPDDGADERRWQEHLAQQKEREKKQQIAELPPNAVESMNFNYRVSGGDTTIRPIRVFDDGKKTYIQMAPEVGNREAPVLVVIGANGKQEMVNYRMKDSMYIVDRLFDRAQLVLGAGKKARKVKISRE